MPDSANVLSSRSGDSDLAAPPSILISVDRPDSREKNRGLALSFDELVTSHSGDSAPLTFAEILVVVGLCRRDPTSKYRGLVLCLSCTSLSDDLDPSVFRSMLTVVVDRSFSLRKSCALAFRFVRSGDADRESAHSVALDLSDSVKGNRGFGLRLINIFPSDVSDLNSLFLG